jgi:hypothetical protein
LERAPQPIAGRAEIDRYRESAHHRGETFNHVFGDAVDEKSRRPQRNSTATPGLNQRSIEQERSRHGHRLRERRRRSEAVIAAADCRCGLALRPVQSVPMTDYDGGQR